MGKGLLPRSIPLFLASPLCQRWVGTIYRGQMGPMVRGSYLDPPRAIWIRDPPLRQLGIRGRFLVLGPAHVLRQGSHRPSAPSYRICLVSGEGSLDTLRCPCRLGSLSSMGALLLSPPLGTASGHC